MRKHVYRCHVRFSDVDVYGHVNNVKYLEYYQEARIAFLADVAPGPDAPGAAGQESRMRQVVGRIDVDYRRPMRFRPEPYVVTTWVTRIGRSSYGLGSVIEDAEAQECSRAEATLVAFDLGTGRSRTLSDDERARLEDSRA